MVHSPEALNETTTHRSEMQTDANELQRLWELPNDEIYRGSRHFPRCKITGSGPFPDDEIHRIWTISRCKIPEGSGSFPDDEMPEDLDHLQNRVSS